MSRAAKVSRSAGRKRAPSRRKAAGSRRAGKPSRTAPIASGVAPGMQAVNTYLAVANIAASMAFLEQAFGFTPGVVLRNADGRPRYAEMRHGGSVIMLIHKGDPVTATHGAAALYTYVADVDRAAALAREAGAGVEDAEDRPWGDRAAVVTDADGYRWVLATFKKLAAF